MSDFRLGNMATDLAEYTLDMCNKNEGGTLRFPQRMYESYVKRIVDLSLDILQGVFEVNSVHDDMQVRKERRELIVAHCLAMANYIDDNGKAVQRLLNSKKATKKRHIRMMLKQVACGDKSVEDFAKSYQSWRVHALHGDCYKMVNEWDLKTEKFLNEFGYDCKFKKNKVEIYVKDN